MEDQTKKECKNKTSIDLIIVENSWYIKAEYPCDSVEMVNVTYFSIYFLHEPLDFVFTLAGNSA
jgi:hypothetical protein